jgi:hypothetical protein
MVHELYNGYGHFPFIFNLLINMLLFPTDEERNVQEKGMPFLYINFSLCDNDHIAIIQLNVTFTTEKLFPYSRTLKGKYDRYASDRITAENEDNFEVSMQASENKDDF